MNMLLQRVYQKAKSILPEDPSNAKSFLKINTLACFLHQYANLWHKSSVLTVIFVFENNSIKLYKDNDFTMDTGNIFQLRCWTFVDAYLTMFLFQFHFKGSLFSGFNNWLHCF